MRVARTCEHLGMTPSFEDLLARAQAAPIEGWDFSWLAGRATEERPSWRYSEIVAERAILASRMLDFQTGGGEMLARLPHLPSLLVATEGHAPNVALASRRLGARGAYVVATSCSRSAQYDQCKARRPRRTRVDMPRHSSGDGSGGNSR